MVAAEPAAGPRQVVRQHFHDFMVGVHSRLHALQQALPRVVVRSRQGLPVYRYAEPEEEPLVTVARELGCRTAVLCLDELHVTDVADAMMLARLLGCLLTDHGTAVVFTANRKPRDLYRGGPNRSYFEPFIRLLEERLVVLHVGAGTDYRRTLSGSATGGPTRALGLASLGTQAAASPGSTVLLAAGRWVHGPGSEEAVLRAWEVHSHASTPTNAPSVDTAAHAVAGGRGLGAAPGAGAGRAAGEHPEELPVAYGRTLRLPRVCGDTALLSFDQLCGAQGLRTGLDHGGALAAPDFLALCRRFRRLYVSGPVPQLHPAQRDEARRLVTLLDVAYDTRCSLVVAAAVPPDELFRPLLEAAREQGVSPRLGLAKSVPLPMAHSAHGQEAASGNASPQSTHGSGPARDVTNHQPPLQAPLPSGLHNTIHAHEFTGNVQQLDGAGAAGSARLSPAAGGQPQGRVGGAGAAAGSPARPGDLAVPGSLVAEEVVMYHRAASRLAEMCRVEVAAV